MKRVRPPPANPTVPIVVEPASVLATPAAPIDAAAFAEAGPAVDALAGWVARLQTAHREQRGLGIAAPQVGLGVRLIIVDALHTGGLLACNPTILGRSGFEAEGTEGCFSRPGALVPVRRARWVDVAWFDVHGRPQRHRAQGLEARVWQHECDHLDGRILGGPTAVPKE